MLFLSDVKCKLNRRVINFVSCYSAWTADIVQHQELYHDELTGLLQVPVSELNMTAR